MSLDHLEKAPDAYRTISEVAEDLDIPQHVLRFWETRFSQIRPLKRGGGRRYYRPDDVALIKGIRALLYGQGYTIKGVQRILKDQGLRQVQALGRGEAGPEPRKSDLALESAEADGDLAAAEIEDIEEEAAAVAPDPASDAGDGAEEPPAPAAGRAAPAPALSAEARRRLDAALAELAACRRVISVARENG